VTKIEKMGNKLNKPTIKPVILLRLRPLAPKLDFHVAEHALVVGGRALEYGNEIVDDTV
jgi:hypothetical protein